MIIVSVIIIFIGLVLLIKPSWLLFFSDQVKTNESGESLDLFLISVRFGGILCTLAGFGWIFIQRL